MPRKAPLRLAGEWESWLKSKDALACGFDMPTLVGWLQRWVADLVSLRLAGRCASFPQYDILHGLSGRFHRRRCPRLLLMKSPSPAGFRGIR